MKKEVIKPFDLEKAKAGAKLKTRDGRSVEIFKWDARGVCPIKGIIKEEEQDLTACWDSEGFWRKNHTPHSYDLVIVEEVEGPRFNVGDWITNGKYTFKIVEVTDNCYKCNSSEGATYINSMNYVDKHYHLWTIRDAKDGDIISYDDEWTCIFKHIHGIWYSSYCFITANEEFHTGYEQHAVDTKLDGNAHPSTKEQRNLLFKKMKEAGYEWDEDALKLREISNKTEQQSPDTIKIKQTDDGAVVIAGLNNLQYGVINDLIMSWNIINYPANKK